MTVFDYITEKEREEFCKDCCEICTAHCIICCKASIRYDEAEKAKKDKEASESVV